MSADCEYRIKLEASVFTARWPNGLLCAQRNIHFLGEVSYRLLPYYLHGFDLFFLPFRIDPLTLATNPVKLYEHLSAGKPVVSADLAEARQRGGLVKAAKLGTTPFG